jgi:hypothetical protein
MPEPTPDDLGHETPSRGLGARDHSLDARYGRLAGKILLAGFGAIAYLFLLKPG